MSVPTKGVAVGSITGIAIGIAITILETTA